MASDSKSAVLPATIASASLVAQLVAGKATRDALFLTHFGLSLLPAAMIAAAALSAVSVLGMSRVLTRVGPARVVPATFALSAVLFLVEWSISLKNPHAAAIAVYAHTAVFSTATGSAFWSLVNERWNPHEAKRLVGRITSGGTIGGVIGGLLVWRASAVISVPMMLALLAGMNVVGLWGALRTAPAERRKKSHAIVASGGVHVLGETPYLRDLAILVGAGAVMQALLDWLLSAHATAHYEDGAPLLGFFAFFNMIVGVLTFVAQMGLTRVILEKQGLGGTIKLQPAGVAAGVVLALVFPIFWPVLVLRVIEGVTRGSLYRSAYELFYTPLPAAKKRATKTLIDVGVDRIGTALGSGGLFFIAQLGSLELRTRVVLLAVLATAILAWLVGSRLQGGYVEALAASLKSGAVDLDDDDVGDLLAPRTLAETTALLDRERLLTRIGELQRNKERGDQAPPSSTAAGLEPPALTTTADLRRLVDPADALVTRVAALRSSDTPAIKRALQPALTPAVAPFVVPLLANDAVVRDAVRALRKIAPRITGLLVDHLLDTEIEPRVRRRIPRILKVCRSARAASGLLSALRDPVFDVRIQVAIALGQLVHDAKIPVDRAEVLEAAHDELTTGRATWTAQGDLDELRRGLGHVFAILGLVLEREPLSIAYRALRSEDAALRGTAIEYLDVVLPPRLRDVVVPLLGEVEAPPRGKDRDASELAAELLRSQSGMLRPSR